MGKRITEKKGKKGKKGGIIWQVLIPLIVLIIVGVIIFFFLKAIPFKETVDKEACHQSVLLRSQKILTLNPGQTLGIPLRCKTEEITINSINEEEIKRTIANAMYDCWWMFGKGELNFFSRGWTKDTYCVLCSTIEFGENTQKVIKEVKGIDEYLIQTKVPGQKFTYAQFLTTEESPQITKEQDPVIDTSKKYTISYAMIERSAAAAGATSYATGAIGLVLGFKVGGVKGAVVGAGLFAAGGRFLAGQIQNWIEGTDSDYYVAMELVPFEAQALRDFGCTSIESIP